MTNGRAHRPHFAELIYSLLTECYIFCIFCNINTYIPVMLSCGRDWRPSFVAVCVVVCVRAVHIAAALAQQEVAGCAACRLWCLGAVHVDMQHKDLDSLLAM